MERRGWEIGEKGWDILKRTAWKVGGKGSEIGKKRLERMCGILQRKGWKRRGGILERRGWKVEDKEWKKGEKKFETLKRKDKIHGIMWKMEDGRWEKEVGDGKEVPRSTQACYNIRIQIIQYV